MCDQEHVQKLSFIHAEIEKIGKGTVMLPTSMNKGLCQNVYPW